MKVLFRVDSSIRIGTGHIMRCLTLAQALTKQGVKTVFICRDLEGNLINKVIETGFEVKVLPRFTNTVYGTNNPKEAQDYSVWLEVDREVDARETADIVSIEKPDWVVVDHYGIDQKWQQVISKYDSKILVIDDLFNRKHLCDILVDQNYGSQRDKYVELVPASCQILCGPTYTLLRSEFKEHRILALNNRRSDSISTIIVSMGGVDEYNYTERVIDVLNDSRLIGKVKEVIVLLGRNCPHQASIQNAAYSSQFNVKVLIETDNVAQLLSKADLAIGAVGSTTWERFCLGVPSILMVIAANQNDIAKRLARDKLIELAACTDDIPNILLELLEDRTRLKLLSERPAEVIDALGADRITEKILS
ncbi:UDP-2,4-diacetamido-2,4,6-trideoxy-beta-L-altropyranose hydrolase [Alteromonas mediterranea]|uniref:UDP-2,4-diacetamido-2,4, 6-trideoxy-beta-L-altropyranose hydrolase n=1 Tax=Alteromonas mediterranea TaxID=314275 RepID=UPI000903C76D|nr:UDP-2,4-diacetamido-2,4,6-trideoxy-beta-L-altropyranose hydrolase [Alteromonas mediterranea]APD95385.1 UDP-2,4-diacetamido-2,4,6-trideoxy-beta-L-altropyranose hydrolase [Alteromonas mediterranea]APD99018.1 UDP-2,4-diacetamido-2,4,6-trideoxy-beta-L-altropyranose hydrolase [Alteromonas mediterranea]